MGGVGTGAGYSNLMKQVIVLIGPPGSGKGTQANLLAEKLDFYHLETSRLIEKAVTEKTRKKFIEVKGKKYYFQNEKKIWEEGKLNSRSFVDFLIKERVKDVAQTKKGIIFSGSPRETEEAEVLMPSLKKLYGKSNIKVFRLDLKLEQSIWRNSHRRICELMRHPMLYNKETIKLTNCPLDGSKLIKRALDKPSIIKKRFRVYEEQTFPLVDFLKKQDFKVHSIDGEQSVADVFSDILKFLK